MASNQHKDQNEEATDFDSLWGFVAYLVFWAVWFWFIYWLWNSHPIFALLLIAVILAGWLFVGFTAFLVSLFISRQ